MSNENQNQDFIIDDVDLSDPNLTGWDGSSGPTLPAGEYEFEVVAIDVEATKKGDGRNLKLILAVKTEGEFYDQEQWQWLKIPGPNDKAGTKRRMAHVVRDVLGVPLLPQGGFETKHLIGRRMIARVTHEESIEYDSVTNQETKKVRTKIEGERPVNGGNGGGGQQQTAAPSAPPNAPPASAKPAGAPAQARRPAAQAPAPRGR